MNKQNTALSHEDIKHILYHVNPDAKRRYKEAFGEIDDAYVITLLKVRGITSLADAFKKNPMTGDTFIDFLNISMFEFTQGKSPQLSYKRYFSHLDK